MSKRKDKDKYIHIEAVDAGTLFGAKAVWGSPPCKVGDKVYITAVHLDEEGKPQTVVVERDVLDIVPTFMQVMYVKDMTFNSDDVGKAVFLTREEAEKALANRGKGK